MHVFTRAVKISAVAAATLAVVLAHGVSLAQPLPKALQNKTAKVTMLEFSAPWCLSCKKIQPEVAQLQKELGRKFVVQHLNVDLPETAKYINLYKIESAPTFVLYDNHGKQLQRIERDITATELRSIVMGYIRK